MLDKEVTRMQLTKLVCTKNIVIMRGLRANSWVVKSFKKQGIMMLFGQSEA